VTCEVLACRGHMVFAVDHLAGIRCRVLLTGIFATAFNISIGD